MDSLVRSTRFTTFDGRQSLTAQHQRPDRYQHIELPQQDTPRIARGGGYSYSAASFGQDSLVQDMSCFNRFLHFDETALTLTVEPGVTLADILAWALPRQLYFPVMPGYPLITVGGCVAVDAHGKHPQKDGTFTDWVTGLMVYHPAKGLQECAPDYEPLLFELTCGGYGLTGVITSVTLQLVALPGRSLMMTQRPVGGLADAAEAVDAVDSDLAYSWHDLCPGDGFGRGIVYTGHWATEGEVNAAEETIPSFRAINARTRARLPISLWNRWTARTANAALLWLSTHRKAAAPKSLFEATFPFASNPYFHLFFGRGGFHELQVLVGHDEVAAFLQDLESLAQRNQAPTMMASIKGFRGGASALSMTGSGHLVTVVCHRGSGVEAFLSALDELIIEHQAQPNLAKDSRVSQRVAEATLPHYTSFKERLFSYDPSRLMRSELSERVGLS